MSQTHKCLMSTEYKKENRRGRGRGRGSTTSSHGEISNDNSANVCSQFFFVDLL